MRSCSAAAGAPAAGGLDDGAGPPQPINTPVAHMAAIPDKEAADRPARSQAARRDAGDVAGHLDDDLERRARGEREEHRGQQVARRVAPDPRAEDRRRAGDQREQREAPERHPRSRSRCGDPEPLGDVVHHEADHEESTELQLARRERGSDGEALAEIVDADPDRDEERQREAAGPDLPSGEPSGEERHPERARRQPEEDEPRPS